MPQNGLSTLLMFALIFVVMYFFMIRPQQKKMKELKKFREALKKGDSVVSTGGLHAKVHEVRENGTIVVDANGSKLIFDKDALSPSFNPAEKR